MVYNQFCRFRRLLFVLSILISLVLLNRILLNTKESSSSGTNVRRPSFDHAARNRNFKRKLVEINDRQPSFKMYIYEGYEISNDRHRAQAKLLDNIKLHDKCQQNPNYLVVDVGASLGQFGLYAAACGCQVYMFEVDPMKLALLEASIELNSLQARITLVRKAISDLPSNRLVYISVNRSRQVPESEVKENTEMYAVESISLSQMNFSSEIYLLRVDVEGYEIHVIRAGERLFRDNLIHHVLFQYTPSGTDRVIQNDLLGYMRDILNGRRFYALHPKQAIIYGPLYNEDIDQFYAQHQAQNVERDVYVLFQDEDLNIDSKPYEFQTSFE